MKVLGRLMTSFGFCVVLIGGSAMDSASLFAPLVIVLCGIGLMLNGLAIEEQMA